MIKRLEQEAVENEDLLPNPLNSNPLRQVWRADPDELRAIRLACRI